jgi:nucleotide-binding universal stress UspA family protein
MKKWNTLDDVADLFDRSDPPTEPALPGADDSPIVATEDETPFERILVPIEATDSSLSALPAMSRLAGGAGLLVRLVHVRVWDPAGRGGGRSYLETTADATAVLDKARAVLSARGIQATGTIINTARSRAATAIVREAEDWGADLIAMASRRRGILSALLMGSVSQRVLREASCPVLIVHPTES